MGNPAAGARAGGRGARNERSRPRGRLRACAAGSRRKAGPLRAQGFLLERSSLYLKAVNLTSLSSANSMPMAP